jgi:hypothetical protein
MVSVWWRGKVRRYSSTKRKGPDVKGTTNLYEEIQTGSGATGANEWEKHDASGT